jgi:hypothetical protein
MLMCQWSPNSSRLIKRDYDRQYMEDIHKESEESIAKLESDLLVQKDKVTYSTLWDSGSSPLTFLFRTGIGSFTRSC